MFKKTNFYYSTIIAPLLIGCPQLELSTQKEVRDELVIEIQIKRKNCATPITEDLLNTKVNKDKYIEN